MKNNKRIHSTADDKLSDIRRQYVPSNSIYSIKISNRTLVGVKNGNRWFASFPLVS